jgi:hypothetical protein
MIEYSRPNGLKCTRCDFRTNASTSFVEQDAELMEHLHKKHPNWMTDSRVLAIKEVTPVSDADKIAAKDEQVTRLKVLLREWYALYYGTGAVQEIRCLWERTDKELSDEDK